MRKFAIPAAALSLGLSGLGLAGAALPAGAAQGWQLLGTYTSGGLNEIVLKGGQVTAFDSGVTVQCPKTCMITVLGFIQAGNSKSANNKLERVIYIDDKAADPARPFLGIIPQGNYFQAYPIGYDTQSHNITLAAGSHTVQIRVEATGQATMGYYNNIYQVYGK